METWKKEDIAFSPVVLALVLAASPLYSRGEEPYFPAAVFCPRNPDLNAIEEDLHGRQLKVLKEPSLWTLSQQDRALQGYRLLWLATGERPVCVRVVRSGAGISS